jgi:hypothetical protein
MQEATVELWVKDHQEHEHGMVMGHLWHARIPLDPRSGDYLVVGDDEVEPALALGGTRETDGTVRLRVLPGRADSHEEFLTRSSSRSSRSRSRQNRLTSARPRPRPHYESD